MRDDQFSTSGPADPYEVLRRLWSADASAPGQLGRFEVLRELGRGGMGIVFLAIDPKLGCKVALKVPTLAALLSVGARRRFLNEARAAALLDHPNIVPIREAGEAGALWYIASAYCEGPTLAAWLAERGGTLPPAEAAELVVTLADAVEYMHGRGILHRDLKPANILLTAGADGPIPRITDFGLAKVRDGAGDTTGTCAGRGTPAYMAPEQAAGAKSVGAPADVYSLGAILYELLAGRPPLQGPTPAETYRMIVAEEPPPLRRHQRGLPRDLEAICLKCLEKEPAKRYATAKELADDLRRFLAGKPTLARPLTPLARAGKWLRRRSAFASLAAVSATAIIGLAGILLAEAFRPIPPVPNKPGGTEGGEPSEEQLVQWREKYATAIKDARRYWEQGDFKLARAELESQHPRRGPDLRGFEWNYLNRLVHPRPRVLCQTGQPYFALALSADGKLLAAAGPPNSLRIWDTATWTLLGQWKHGRTIYGLAFSPDGKTLASVGGVNDIDGVVELRSVATGELRQSREDFSGSLDGVAFIDDGKNLAVCGPVHLMDQMDEKDTWVLDSETLNERCQIGTSPTQPGRSSTCIAVSPLTGEWAVGWGTRGNGGIVRLRGLAGLPAVKCIHDTQHAEQVLCVAYSPRDPWVVCGSLSNRLSLQRIDPDGTSHAPTHLNLRPARVRALAFTPDGRYLAAGHSDGVVKLLDFPGGQQRPAYIRAHGEREVRGLTFTLDGQSLITAGTDGTVKVWDAMDVFGFATLPGHEDRNDRPKETQCVAHSPDGRTRATVGEDKVVRVLQEATGVELLSFPVPSGIINSLAFSSDGTALTAALHDGTIRIWRAPHADD